MTDSEIILNSEADMEILISWLKGLISQEKTFRIKAYDTTKRTNRQNNSLHKWCELTAEALNAAGLDMKKTLKQDAEIPWNKELVKEFIWRPVMKAVAGVDSTMDMDTVDPTPILEVITRHLASTHGFHAPAWPSMERPRV